MSSSISTAGPAPPQGQALGEGRAQHRGPRAVPRCPFHPTAMSDARREQCPKRAVLSHLGLPRKASCFRGCCCCFLQGALSPAAALGDSTGVHTEYSPPRPHGHLTTGRGFSPRGQLPPTTGASGAAYALRRAFASGPAAAPRGSAGVGAHKDPAGRGQCAVARPLAEMAAAQPGAEQEAGGRRHVEARCGGNGAGPAAGGRRGGDRGSNAVCFAGGSGSEEALPCARVLGVRAGRAAGASGAGFPRNAMTGAPRRAEPPRRLDPREAQTAPLRPGFAP